MTDQHHNSYESLIARLRSAELKKIAQRWGGSNQTRKDENLALILAGLRDPERVREMVARLPDMDRLALGRLREAGGRIDGGALMAGLRMSGVEMPRSRTWHDRTDRQLLRSLIERGTILRLTDSDPTYIDDYSHPILTADARLLAAVTLPQIAPLQLAAAAAPTAVLARRPATVGMELAGIYQAIDTLGGLQLTKAGDLRANETRRLARALKWPEDALVTDGQRLLQPVAALTAALAKSPTLEQVGDRVMVRDPAALASRSYAQQVADLLRGFLSTTKWREDGDEHNYAVYDARYPAMRTALVVALTALPAGDGPFFAIDDLSTAIFDRVGEHLSLSFRPHAPYFFDRSPAVVSQAEAEWRTKLRADWQKLERPWIERALTSWVFFLGLIELGLEGDRPVSLRLSDLGRAVLRGEDGDQGDAQPSDAAWVVQPDFEVLVYLDHATPAQVAFVEGHAERAQVQAHIARYRFTRDSVQRGLQSGTTLDQLLATLDAGASAALPQNVQTTLREWAAQHQRITLRRSGSVLEFPSAAARDVALQAGLAGTAVGERFILVEGSASELPYSRIDYAHALPACLSANEDGTLRLSRKAPDLLLRPQLGRWAEPVDDTSWRLTADSVARAIRAGGTITGLLAWLRERLIHPPLPLLVLVLRSWAGKPPAVDLAAVVVLRCKHAESFAAIAGSALLAPYLRGVLAPDLLLVDSAQLPALRERLAWAGLAISDTLEVD